MCVSRLLVRLYHLLFTAPAAPADPWQNYYSTLTSGYKTLVTVAGVPAPTAGTAVNGYVTAYFDSTAVSFDPATLSLTGWWRANYAASPWIGTASTGTSSTHDLTAGTAPSASGGLQNGYQPAHFVAASSQYLVGAALSALLTGPAWSIRILFYADSATADPGSGSRFGGPCLLADTDAYFVVAYTASGVTLEMADGVGAASTLTVACATGGWHEAFIKYDNTNLSLAIDSGAASTQAYANLGALTGTLRVGSNWNNSSFFDGKILDIIVSNTTLSSGNFTSINSYDNSRYALAL